MRRVLVLVPLLVLACDRGAPTPTEVQPIGGTSAIKPEFSIGVSPAELAVERGATASATITITKSRNFAKEVSFSVAGVPEGVTAALDPQVTLGDASVVTFTASSSAPLGTSTIIITGRTPGRDPETTTLQLTVVRPLVPITLDFCASDAPLWFAYQNEGEAWTQVVPDANSAVFFRATETVGIAITRNRRNVSGIALDGARITNVLYVTAEELRPLSGVTCRNEFGSKIINGTVNGLSSGDNGLVSLHLIPFTVNSFAPTFRATRKPDAGAMDLIATRRPSGGEPVSFIVRRGLELANEATVDPIDFASSEAVAAEVPAYTVTGLRGVSDQMFVDFWTGATRGGLPSYQRLVTRFSGVTTAGTYRAAPASLLMPGDRHEMTVRTGFNADYSGVTSVFSAAGPQNLAIGPSLSPVTFQQIAGSSPPRFRATFASQSEYGATARLIANGGNIFTVEATAAFHGNTPGVWELETPDFTAVSGWSADWNIAPGQNVVLDASGWSMAAVDIPALWIENMIPPWARPFADGSMVNFASRRLIVFAQ
jgi:hypothetical protein